MNGMLHHHDAYRAGVDHHQGEARRRAREGALGGLTRSTVERAAASRTEARLGAVASPIVTLLVLLVLIAL